MELRFRDSLDPLLAMDHEGERPGRVALAGGAVAGGFAAARVAEAERTGQEIIREVQPADQFELALADPGSLRTLGLVHLAVIILQEFEQRKQNKRTRK